jgi:hypothetical protein
VIRVNNHSIDNGLAEAAGIKSDFVNANIINLRAWIRGALLKKPEYVDKIDPKSLFGSGKKIKYVVMMVHSQGYSKTLIVKSLIIF